MNLLDKHKGQILLLLSALFFFSCEEDLNQQGYKAVEHFDVLYREIPIVSTVYLADSIVTTNLNLAADLSPRRLLVGQYDDQKFGHISSGAYTQFFASTLPDSLNYSQYDSVSLNLAFDLSYTYGSPAVSQQEIGIYELDDTLALYGALPYYFNSSVIKTNPTLLGAKPFTVSPAIFADQYSINIKDPTIAVTKHIRIPLDGDFGRRLFENIKKLENANSEEDSVYVNYPLFVKEFKGLSIASLSGDKMIGFDPSNIGYSKIIVHFHKTATNKRDSAILTFQGLTSFNRIQGDRSGSELSGLTQKYQPYTPSTNRLYLQNGTGVTTKLDFANFLTFADSTPNMIINSAELVLDGVETDDLAPPTNLMLWDLKGNDRFNMLASSKNTAGTIADYGQTLLYNNNILRYDNYVVRAFSVKPDRDFISSSPTGISLSYLESEKKYSGFITFFVDELARKKNGKMDFSKLGLYALSPSAGKTVNRVSFNSVKLRIYYTRSVKNNQ